MGALEALLAVWDVPVYAHTAELPFLTGSADYPPPDPTVGGGRPVLTTPLLFALGAGVPHVAPDRGIRPRSFGVTEEAQVQGDDQVTLTVPNTGQLVILRKVDQVAERSTRAVKGPHVDFRIAPELYPPILEKFNRKEYYWGPDPTKIPWHEQGGQTVYGYDPFGNRIQIGHSFARQNH